VRDGSSKSRAGGRLERLFRSWYAGLLDRSAMAGADRAEAVEVAVARLRDRRSSGVWAAMRFAMKELVDAARLPRTRALGASDPAIERTSGGPRRGRGDRAMDFAKDVGQALRGLRRRPVLVVGVTLTLALGLAATTVMYSVVSSVLWRPLPFAQPDRVFMVWGYYPELDLGYPELPVHGLQFSRIREEGRVFESIAAFKSDLFNLEAGGTRERVDGLRTTGALFRALGVHPAIGRFFDEGDEAPGSDRIVVLSHDLWLRRFNGDPGIVGNAVRINGEPYTVLAVAPAGFAFPRGGDMPQNFQMPKSTALWVPMAPATSGPSDLAMVGRVRSGVTTAVMQEDLDRISAVLSTEYHVKDSFLTRAVSMRTQVIGDVAPTLIVLLAAVFLVLLIACANAAQMLLAAAIARRRELALRAALGAPRGRLVRQMFVEALALALFAGGCGMLLAAAGIRAVRAFGPTRLPRLAEISLDPRVIAFALGLTLLTGLLFGIVPALAGTRVDPFDAMRAGGRNSSGGLPSRLRQGLLAAEVAVSLVLLAGAGLLMRSLVAQYRTDLGFHSGALTFEVTLPPVRYPETRSSRPTYLDNDRVIEFIDHTIGTLRELPGVEAASMAKPLPLSGAQEATVYTVEGAPAPAPGESPPFAEYTVIGPDFFQTMGAPMISGREFTTSDRRDSDPVVVVNRAMAEKMWPDEDPVGRRIKLPPPNRPWMTVVGVAPDLKQFEVTEAARPVMFVPFTQGAYPPLATSTFVVRTRGDSRALLPSLRRSIAQIDAELPIAGIRTIDDLIGQATAEPRFAALLVSGFAIAASLLAAIGLAGLTLWLATQRRREMGVRIALGATRSRIVGEVLRDGILVVAIGSAAGIVAALALTRLMRGMLYDVSPLDPLTFIASPLALMAAVGLACAIPALRASRVDPRAALDAE
jgi:putative ABC transport system permease protein